MAKTSFYSGSGATSNDVDAVDSLKTAAENAKTAAETAQAAAETAKSGADTAKSGADTSAANAATSATAAASSASAASTSATAAATSATAAAASASSVNNYTGGTGITVSGTTITNDSPDQTVALTAGSNVSVSGTYPNFTISATDTNTTYSVGDGGLTEKNFTTTLKNKLDAVEANATADQTAAEIRAAVEAASDSNVFTDADHSKLDGIATSANNYSLPTASGSTLGGIKIGSGLSIDGSGVVTASGGGGGSSLTVQDEGSSLSTAATTMNFVGNGVVASGTGATKTITVTDTNTTYSVGNGGLTEKNFTTALNTKLSGIEANATADQTASEIEAIVNHDNLQGFVAAEHIDWTSDQGSTNIHAGNYTNTTYSVGDGGLTQNNFTNTLKSKLDGIEASATADQTAAEIRTLVEAATDSNVFTDADHSKLNAIEANATADQTASEIKTAYESNSDTNTFTDAEKTKLSGVAASANNYVHPNHSGEVTSTADGATVISDNVVDEANLKVSNAPTDGYFLQAQSGNTGGLTWAAASGGGSSGMPTTGGTFTGDVDFGTNLLGLGSSSSVGFDISYSTGLNALLLGTRSTYRGIYLRSASFTVQTNGYENAIVASQNGSVDLYYDNAKKAETTSSGLQTTGTLNVNGAYTLPTADGSANQVLTTNGSGVASWAAASGGSSVGGSTGVDFNDNVKARFGTGNDLEIYHSGGSAFIDDVGDGSLGIRSNGFGVNIMTTSGYFMGQFSTGGAATLYHNGNAKIGTTSSGIQTTGTVNVNGAYTLPTADGSANQVLTTNGSGVASWAAASGGGADLYAANESSPTAQPSATGGNAIAIGDSAAASGDDGFAIGAATTASGLHSLAMGNSSTASGQWSTSIGDQTVASGRSSIAMGYHGDATANFSVAIGNSSTGHGPQATALGAMALGGAKASGTDSFAVQNQDTSGTYGATGANSVSIGYIAKASGSYAYAGGSLSTASGYGSIAVGTGSTASGHSSIALGGRGLWNAQATAMSSIAIGDGARSAVKGKMAFAGYGMQNPGSQGAWYTLYSDTTDATAEAMTTTRSTASTDNQIVLPDNSAYAFHGTIVARESAAAGSDYASWEIKGALLRDANAASTVLGNGIVNKLYATSGASAWSVALSADTTNGGLKVEVTGAASTNIRWVATVNTSEVIYA